MYGSTYLHSWLRIFSEPEVQKAVDLAREKNGRMVVLGSTIGWQGFYGAVILGLPVVGYELMGSRVAVANAVKAALDPATQVRIS